MEAKYYTMYILQDMIIFTIKYSATLWVVTVVQDFMLLVLTNTMHYHAKIMTCVEYTHEIYLLW